VGAVYSSSGINKFPLLIKYKKMRGAKSAVTRSYLLGGIIQVNPGEIMFFHPLNHMGKGIFLINAGTIRIYSCKFYSSLDKSFSGLPGNFIRTNHIRAVITGEKNHQKR